ncbi:MAG: hypothetical protein ACRD3N_01180 [Terracidiphilus sp.]
MTTIPLGETELATIVAALRLFRHVTSDLADMPKEQGKEMTLMVARQVTRSETGEPLMLLGPAQIDDLIDRLKPVTEV